MASGVAVNDECAIEFTEMKLRKKYRFIIFGISKDEKQIIIYKRGDRNLSYDDFLAELQEAETGRECRYGVVDVDYKDNEDQDRQKIVFLLWSPESATVKQKMLYTSSKDYIKRVLVGLGKEAQATDMSEASLACIIDQLKQR